MNMLKSVPLFVRQIFFIFLVTVVIFFVARLLMLGLVLTDIRHLPLLDILQALYIGIKFDCRIAVFVCLPVCIILGIPFFYVRLNYLRPFLIFFYALFMTLIELIYIFDFGFYFYLRQRMDTTMFDLLPDLGISASMIWQSYPVIPVILGLTISFVIFSLIIRRLLPLSVREDKLGLKRRTGWTVLTATVLFLLAYGQISSNFFPLRWSNAYFSPNRYLVILALNPVQNLRDSYRAMQSTPPDIKAAQTAYPEEADRLGVPVSNRENLNLWRIVPGREQKRPNIVVIIMESLGTPRTSLASGLFTPNYKSSDPGPHDPTPNLRRLAEKSIYFPWFVAPTRTTARAIFTTMTGIPDVNRSGGTSSRNPLLVDQFSIVNEFAGYDKSYMLGGSANWANIRGILTYNIKGLKLLEEEYWKAPNTDVWGISDLALLRESIDYYDSCDKPFISFIQTAGFHRPWSIPEDNAGFVHLSVGEDIIHHYGFENIEEYNSMRFADHALGEFFRLARQKSWFDNTIFVIFGDHGLNGTSANVPDGYLGCRLQSNHVPLLLYAPGREDLFSPGVIDIPCGQPDILPTLAYLAGITYRNHGMGRNLLDAKRIQKDKEGEESQFLGGDAENFMRLLQGGYCYFNEQNEALYLIAGSGENLLEREGELARVMRHKSENAFYISKYLLFNNQKDKAPPLPESDNHP